MTNESPLSGPERGFEEWIQAAKGTPEWVNPPGGSRKSAQNGPLAEACFFRSTRALILGKFGLATEHQIPRITPDCTARLWALLFLGFLQLRKHLGMRGNRAA
jgi:hypothetical protein